MFTVSLRRLNYVCDKVIIRNLRNSQRPGAVSNPGLQRRINAFQKEGLKIQDEDADEFMEQSESDLSNVGYVYDEHLSESLASRHRLKYHIVKEKYFKENMPNLLTWSEKEQIRHLATTQPDEWTPEKIAESFPVTVPVVKKLLKYPWKPTTEQRIARHDASAMRNWRDLQAGNFDIPAELREHFLKFSNRSIPPLNRNSIKTDLTQEEKLGEFERIIQRCALKDEQTDNHKEQNFSSTHKSLVTVENQNSFKKDKKMFTLDELTAKIKTRLEKGSDVQLSDKIMLDTISSEPNTNIQIQTQEFNNQIDLPSEENKNTGITQSKEKNKDLEIPKYPLRIRIPKKAFKHGATYKVNDCYYDYDGRFLYRVIGMSTKY